MERPPDPRLEEARRRRAALRGTPLTSGWLVFDWAEGVPRAAGSCLPHPGAPRDDRFALQAGLNDREFGEDIYLTASARRRRNSGRPHKEPDSVAADTAYSNGPCRRYLRRRGIRHTIPEKAGSQTSFHLRPWSV